MAKIPLTLLDDSPQPPRRRLGAAWAIVLGLLFSPVIYESSAICVANWKAMNNQLPAVDTPVLNALSDGFADLREAVPQTMVSLLRELSPRPERIIGLIAAWALIVSLLLRGHTRH
jgi:hypothetical protein